ncbi:Zinc finger ZZ-type protein [Macrophomina phaseolina MS6]|uniref:Zinc finger ZZ-type protein n=1 Tax=Macrophomina phaseolina (strain MS6) TaxID=1126212 RepID=K2SZT0_MACPH|nr:Zinc finger ZZ-type protein [Macrophomina phaseolina MS6]
MPTLKQLTCQVERETSPEPLKEYSTNYGDGVVETFLAIPDAPAAFTIHLTSSGYIAPGLAMFVYIDGVYQCNRNRKGLVAPDDTVPPDFYEVDFRVRQKEEPIGSGRFLSRPWRFEDLNFATADNAPNVDDAILGNLGTIEVVVLRCQGAPVAPEPVISTQRTEPESKTGGDAKKGKRLAIKVKADRAGFMPTLPFGGLDGEDDDEPDLNFAAAFDGASDRRYPNYDGHHHDELDDRASRSHRRRYSRASPSPPPPQLTHLLADYLRRQAVGLDAAFRARSGQRDRSASYYKQYRPNGREDSGRRRIRVEGNIQPNSESRLYQVFQNTNDKLDELGELGERSRQHNHRNPHTHRNPMEAYSGDVDESSTELEMTRRSRSFGDYLGSLLHSGIDSDTLPSRRVIHQETPAYNSKHHPNRYPSYRRDQVDPSLASSNCPPEPKYNPRYAPEVRSTPIRPLYTRYDHEKNSKMPGAWTGLDPFQAAASPKLNVFATGFVDQEEASDHSHHWSPDSDGNFKANGSASKDQGTNWNADAGGDDAQNSSWGPRTDNTDQSQSWQADKNETGGDWRIGGDDNNGQESSWGPDNGNFGVSNDQSGGDTFQNWNNPNDVGDPAWGGSNAQAWGESVGSQQGLENGQNPRESENTEQNDGTASEEAGDAQHSAGNGGGNAARNSGGASWGWGLQDNSTTNVAGDSNLVGSMNANAESSKTQLNDDISNNQNTQDSEWDNDASNAQNISNSEWNNDVSKIPDVGNWDKTSNDATQQATSGGAVSKDAGKWNSVENTAQQKDNSWNTTPNNTSHQTASVEANSAEKAAQGESHWTNSLNNVAQDSGGNWNIPAQTQPIKAGSKASSHSSSSFMHQPRVPELPYIKAYWSNINRPSIGTPHELRSDADLPADAGSVCAPSETPYVVLESTAREKKVKQYVHAGKGRNYTHITRRPQYLDSMEAPYAVFRFKYRSKDMLGQILGKRGKEQIAKDFKQEQEQEMKRRLSELSKKELIARLVSVEANRSRNGSVRSRSKTVKSEKSVVKEWAAGVAAATASVQGGHSDSPDTCSRCKQNLVGEFWHCDVCSDFNICCLCASRGCRCERSHKLAKWKQGQDIIAGEPAPGITGEKLSENFRCTGSGSSKNGNGQPSEPQMSWNWEQAATGGDSGAQGDDWDDYNAVESAVSGGTDTHAAPAEAGNGGWHDSGAGANGDSGNGRW